MSSDGSDGLKVTFNPPLYLERQRWILDVLRREAVQSVLDIGCGEGSLLQCLTEPSRFKAPPDLPATSPFVSGPIAEQHRDLHLKEIHGLDPSPSLEFAIHATAPPAQDEPPFTGYDRWRTRQARWMPLKVYLWEGGFENINEYFHGDKIDAFVASEVIEHLPPALLPLFAPILLGYYRPRLVLLTTPNFTYNQRFSPPGENSPTGYPDPTNRTDRVFRHPDHKFEWTTEEWKTFCTDAASEFGYDVEIGGVGLAVEPDPWDRDRLLGFASQVAVFRRRYSRLLEANSINFMKNDLVNAKPPIFREMYEHLPHPLSLEELNNPPVMENIHQAVEDAMNYHGEGSITFMSAWNHGAVSLACRGDIAALVKAFQQLNPNDEEWSISDDSKGWEGIIVWKKFVIPAEGFLQPRASSDSSSQHTHDSPGRWDGGDMTEEETQPDSYVMGSAVHTTARNAENEWGEAVCTWGAMDNKGNDMWGWDPPREEAFQPASLWLTPEN